MSTASCGQCGSWATRTSLDVSLGVGQLGLGQCGSWATRTSLDVSSVHRHSWVYGCIGRRHDRVVSSTTNHKCISKAAQGIAALMTQTRCGTTARYCIPRTPGAPRALGLTCARRVKLRRLGVFNNVPPGARAFEHAIRMHTWEASLHTPCVHVNAHMASKHRPGKHT